MNGRMKSLHPTSEDLRCLGDIRNIPRMPQINDISEEVHRTHSMGVPASLIFFAVPPEPRRRTPAL